MQAEADPNPAPTAAEIAAAIERADRAHYAREDEGGATD
jgi:hypothetical protein